VIFSAQLLHQQPPALKLIQLELDRSHFLCRLALGLPRGRLPASTEGQFSMNIRQSLTDYSATSAAPSAISATPSQLTMVSFSPSNKLPKIATSTTLSLSTGATCAALPSLSARK
jgi:hypothetical protein